MVNLDMSRDEIVRITTIILDESYGKTGTNQCEMVHLKELQSGEIGIKDAIETKYFDYVNGVEFLESWINWLSARNVNFEK